MFKSSVAVFDNDVSELDADEDVLSKLLVLLLVFSCSLFRLSLSRCELFCLDSFLVDSFFINEIDTKLEKYI